tara:strand:- start:1133 stop:1684 length:552 start_codon:yes stop_codon:yes gene_type:complete
MVKNTTGGSKTKGQARKLISHTPTTTLRFAEDEEVYSQVTATLGNGMCHVLGIDGKRRLCHIRGKFKGRGKRDNLIVRGNYVLVGKRSWGCDEEVTVKGKVKLPDCDLLEVYSTSDIDQIKVLETSLDWTKFSDDQKSSVKDSEIEFKDNGDEDDYNLLMENFSASESHVININNEEINVDEI